MKKSYEKIKIEIIELHADIMRLSGDSYAKYDNLLEDPFI